MTRQSLLNLCCASVYPQSVRSNVFLPAKYLQHFIKKANLHINPLINSVARLWSALYLCSWMTKIDRSVRVDYYLQMQSYKCKTEQRRRLELKWLKCLRILKSLKAYRNDQLNSLPWRQSQFQASYKILSMQKTISLLTDLSLNRCCQNTRNLKYSKRFWGHY